MIDKGITYDQLLSDINALPSTPSADQLATYDLTGDGVLDAGDARYHIASQPLKQLSPLPPPQEGAEASSGLTPDQRLREIMNQSGTGLSGGSLEDILNRGLQGDPNPAPYLGAGANLVEHNGTMVSQDAVNALNMSVGNLDEDLRYDVNGDGKISSQDALQFMQYAGLENYDDGSGFMGNFYAPNPTFTDQVPGYTVGGQEFMGPDMAPSGGGMPNQPPPGMATTMAMGEEDGGNAGTGPDGNVLPGPGAPATTRMVGEEEGMDGFPGTVTTMAMGEEDGGGTPMITTQAMGEEDGGNPFLPAPPPVGVSPPIDIKPPVPIPRPDNPFLNPGPPVGIDPPPPVGGTAPFNPFPQLPTGGQGGRTYGNYQDQFPAEMLAQTSTAKGPFS